jgi:hypothetical protein
VVADIHERGYEPAMMPAMHLPAVQTPNAQSNPRELLVRTKGDPAGMPEAVRRIVWSVNPQQPVARVRTMDDLIDMDVADRKPQTRMVRKLDLHEFARGSSAARSCDNRL